jgi:RNA polymerase sigma-70 factor (ECF subfamily)
MSGEATPVSLFLEQLALAGAPAPEASPEIERALAEVLSAAREAWPELGPPGDDFVRHLARHVDRGQPLPAALRALVAPDLYLACACAHGAPAALRAFERRFLQNFTAHVARVSTEPAFVDEVRQIVCEHLLVSAPGARPRIAEYAGRGALLKWVSISAIRIALRLRASQSGDRPEPDDDALELAGPGDPDTEILRRRHGPDFKLALQEALGALSAEQRNLLRLHYVDGLSIDKIGALQGVHRATAARHLAGLRSAVLAGAKRRLAARLALDPQELLHLARLLESQLDLSLSRILAQRA